MKQLSFFLLSLFTLQKLSAQEFTPDLSSWPAQTIERARKASFHPLCTRQSNEVVFYTNLARMDGTRFVQTVLKPYCEYTGDTAFSEYLQGLIIVLYDKGHQPPLKHDLWLSMMAKSYAGYAGRRGIVGHRRFDQRFRLVLSIRKGVGENCSYGIASPLGVVVQLLVDKDIPDVGHRKNMLSKQFGRIGVGFAKHSRYGINCVQEFSR